jgi:hypothetical protein
VVVGRARGPAAVAALSAVSAPAGRGLGPLSDYKYRKQQGHDSS